VRDSSLRIGRGQRSKTLAELSQFRVRPAKKKKICYVGGQGVASFNAITYLRYILFNGKPNYDLNIQFKCESQALLKTMLVRMQYPRWLVLTRLLGRFPGLYGK